MERDIYGHNFQQAEGLILEGWTSTDGNKVTVTPPQSDSHDWKVWVPHLERIFNIQGENAEARAFSVAVGFVEQQIS